MQPLGVNPAGIESHKSYVEKMQFNFPLLSDPDRAIARAYHALKDDDRGIDRKSTRLNSSHTVISYAVFCLKKKKKKIITIKKIKNEKTHDDRINANKDTHIR